MFILHIFVILNPVTVVILCYFILLFIVTVTK